MTPLLEAIARQQIREDLASEALRRLKLLDPNRHWESYTAAEALDVLRVLGPEVEPHRLADFEVAWVIAGVISQADRDWKALRDAVEGFEVQRGRTVLEYGAEPSEAEQAGAWDNPQPTSPERWSAELGEPSGAEISSCGRYRYLLWRTIEEHATAAPLVFVMLNPSTADVSQDDPTIRRCLGFARRERAGGILVANLCPWRTSSPAELTQAHQAGQDVLSLESNRVAIERAARCGPVVMAWGAGLKPWMGAAALLVMEAAGAAWCLGRSKGGQPRHPLYLAGDTPLEPFTVLRVP